jgi:hypothetical protein
MMEGRLEDKDFKHMLDALTAWYWTEVLDANGKFKASIT